jgi:glyoxylase-like metal-dependent hydrolase (beta-lactamase superfamily II)
VISGDVLFARSIGRTDLWQGSTEVLMHSIETKLLPLPDNTVVWSGHGRETTILAEKQMNPFLRK